MITRISNARKKEILSDALDKQTKCLFSYDACDTKLFEARFEISHRGMCYNIHHSMSEHERAFIQNVYGGQENFFGLYKFRPYITYSSGYFFPLTREGIIQRIDAFKELISEIPDEA